ncbi:MAG: hypothetical protein CMJ85_10710 [Planctomycetes bacterium]|nr:hypothetical protein [Planctomycetota bacterium]
MVASHLSEASRNAIGRAATRALETAEACLAHGVEKRVTVTVVRRVDDLPDRVRSAFRSWTVAIAVTHKHQVFVATERLTSDPPSNLETTLSHELVHTVLGDLELELSAGKRRLPRWLHEGLAQDIAGEMLFGANDRMVLFRVRTGRLVPWSALEDSWPDDANESRAAYAQSASFVGYLRGRLGMKTIIGTARAYLRGEARNLDEALHQVTWGDSYTYRAGQWSQDIQGATLVRLLRDNCFSILIVLAIPLFAVVMYKRWKSERAAAARLDAWELQQRDVDET